MSIFQKKNSNFNTLHLCRSLAFKNVQYLITKIQSLSKDTSYSMIWQSFQCTICHLKLPKFCINYSHICEIRTTESVLRSTKCRISQRNYGLQTDKRRQPPGTKAGFYHTLRRQQKSHLMILLLMFLDYWQGQHNKDQ